jgi:hypothetical protein
MRDGRGRTPEPHHMHARDTGDTPGKRWVRGTVKSSDPEVGNSCEVQEEGRGGSADTPKSDHAMAPGHYQGTIVQMSER